MSITWEERARIDGAAMRKRTPGIVLKEYFKNILDLRYLEDLANKMDAWSVQECTDNIDVILKDLELIAKKSNVIYNEPRFRSYVTISIRLSFKACQVRIRGVGSNLSIIANRLKYNDCTGCSELSRKMNKWGPDGCREPENMKEILDEMQARAEQYKLFWPGRTVVKLAILLACRITEREERIEDRLDLLNAPELKEWKARNDKSNTK